MLEHLVDPTAVLTRLHRLLHPGENLTAAERDHGSTLCHPDDAAARDVVACQVRLQADAGGDALIWRRLHPLLTGPDSRLRS